MKKSILLVTNGFPFGESERSFLGEEAKLLAQQFHLDILAPENKDPLLYPTDGIRRIRRFSPVKPLHSSGITEILTCITSPIVWKEFWQWVKHSRFQNCLHIYKEFAGTFHKAHEIANQILAMIDEAPVDVIYTYWCLAYTLGALLVKRKYPQIKVVTRFHGYDLYNERTAIGWQPFRTVISQKCDLLVFACNAGRDYYLSRWGQQWATKSVVAYLGCAPLTKIPYRNTTRLTLVSCSYAVPLKRIHLIIEALPLLPEQIAVDWQHIGGGAELEFLKQLASDRLTAHANIVWKFWGYVPNHQLDGLYQQLQPQLFITASSTEGGAPISIQEVFSANIPAIGTAVGGIPELIQNGKTGFLLSKDPSPSEIAEKIATFWSLSPQQRKQMGETAFSLWQEKLDAKKNAQSFCELLKGI